VGTDKGSSGLKRRATSPAAAASAAAIGSDSTASSLSTSQAAASADEAVVEKNVSLATQLLHGKWGGMWSVALALSLAAAVAVILTAAFQVMGGTTKPHIFPTNHGP
jgi:hypothetical protein